MVDEIIEEVLMTYTLEAILQTLEINEEDVLEALLDIGLITRSDLHSLMLYDEEQED